MSEHNQAPSLSNLKNPSSPKAEAPKNEPNNMPEAEASASNNMQEPEVSSASDAPEPEASSELRVLIVNGSPRQATPELVAGLAQECDAVIAVDRGVEVCRAANVVPDAFCGDADSASEEAKAWAEEHINICDIHHVEKDETDLSLALALAERLAHERGCSKFKPILTCATGGWADHELGVMGQLVRYAKWAPMLVEDGYQAMVLCPDGQSFWQLDDLARGNSFSLVPLTECVVSEHNMYWELDHERLEPFSDRGISNIVTTGFACVEVHEGIALAFLYWGRR